MIPYPAHLPAFQEFWTEFLEEQRLLKEYFISVSRLLLYLERMEEKERTEVLEGLLRTGLKREPGYKMAWAALKQWGISSVFIPVLMEEGEKALQSPTMNYEESAILADQLLILYRQDSNSTLGLLRNYLLEYPISPYWTQVAWATWPNHPELFQQSWRRYFLSEAEENWKNSKLIDLFKNQPDTIQPVLNSIRLFSEEMYEKVRGELRA
jgi:hypothetical protein